MQSAMRARRAELSKRDRRARQRYGPEKPLLDLRLVFERRRSFTCRRAARETTRSNRLPGSGLEGAAGSGRTAVACQLGWRLAKLALEFPAELRGTLVSDPSRCGRGADAVADHQDPRHVQ